MLYIGSIYLLKARGRAGWAAATEMGLFFLFFYSHFRPWPPCQPQLPPLPWTTPMTTPNDDSRAKGDDNKDKGSRCREHLEPGYVFFFYSFCFFLLISFSFYSHFRPRPPRQPPPPPWMAPMMTPNDGSRAEGDDDENEGSRCTLLLEPWYVFFLIKKFFFSFYFFFYSFQAVSATFATTTTTTTIMNSANDDAKQWRQGRGRQRQEWGLETHIVSSPGMFSFFQLFIYLFKQTTAVCMRPPLPLQTSSNLVPGLVLCLD